MLRRDSKRDWRRYNGSLVMRGEILLDFDENWERELRGMNEG